MMDDNDGDGKMELEWHYNTYVLANNLVKDKTISRVEYNPSYKEV